VSSKDGFQRLKVLWYNSQYGGGMGLHFVTGAMPQLRRLRVDLDARGTLSKYDDFDIGIQHLPCLVHVHATIDWMSTTLTPSEVDAVEDEIRNKVSLYPNNPVLELNRKMQRPVRKAAEELVIAVHNLEEWSKKIDPSKLVVIHFTTGWCKASRKMAPVHKCRFPKG
jgi:disease resistance protein RPM1